MFKPLPTLDAKPTLVNPAHVVQIVPGGAENMCTVWLVGGEQVVVQLSAEEAGKKLSGEVTFRV
jgi:hypothetical protein